ncbi:MAG TPA: hypothetical protein VGD99_27275 [Anaerolineae bacterium]|jgi:hypothetical protein
MGDKDTILINTGDPAVRRRGPQQLKIDVLTENVNLFLTQMETVLEKTPQDIGKFKFTEFTVSAEISAQGGLVLMGTGVEVGASGGLTFKFQRS